MLFIDNAESSQSGLSVPVIVGVVVAMVVVAAIIVVVVVIFIRRRRRLVKRKFKILLLSDGDFNRL